MTDADEAFDQALYLLDRERGDRAKELLEGVIESSRVAGKEVLLTRALCVLGEWLVEQGQGAEAKRRLTEALAVSVAAQGAVAYERRCAHKLLAQLESPLDAPRHRISG